MNQSTIFDELFIIGEVHRVIFLSESSRFGVLRVLIDDTNTDLLDEVIVTGFFHEISEGESYHFKGKITHHPKYGDQFAIDSYKKEMPQTIHGVIQYLSGDNFQGIGKQTATKIVNELGLDALQKISKDQDVLKDVPGLSAKKRQMIYENVRKNYDAENTFIRLTELGFGQKMIIKIMNHYGKSTLKVIDEQPYQLVKEIKGIGFKTADRIAQMNGILKSDENRLAAAIIYILNERVMNDGHTYVTISELNLEVDKLLNDDRMYFDEQDVDNVLSTLVLKDEIKVNVDRVFLPTIFYSEMNSALQLHELMDVEIDIEDDVDTLISEVEKDIHISYNDAQKQAIKIALKSPVSIITGGPGTGKTTIVKGIIEAFRRLNQYEDVTEYDDDSYPIKLIAPTGRASKRLADLSGLRASTIHRLIGWGLSGDDAEWIDIKEEIEADLIIIDEMSMVDIWLFYQLIKNVPSGTAVVFVGDKDQLPSVGPGNVFHDLIQSEIIPTTELKVVYRQGEGSSIVKLAHNINNGEEINILEKTPNISFIPSEVRHIAHYVFEIVSKAVKKGYDMKDIQVLAPIYRGEVGIDKLNKVLQDILNPVEKEQSEIEFGQVIFREGDKVIQLVNRAEDNVFNGDSGIIESCFLKEQHDVESDTIIVNFDGTTIKYERRDMIELAHAYCTSIHKAQGSEYPIVIMPVVKSYRNMLFRNIIYTGITRAKESLVLCGDPNEFYGALNRTLPERNTTLISQLRADVIEPEVVLPEFLTLQNMHTVPPMIGMEGISPYDFVDKEKGTPYNEIIEIHSKD